MENLSHYHKRFEKRLGHIISKHVEARHRSELKQATWARIADKFHLFDGRNFLAWASTVGRNVAINLRKEIDKRPQLMPGNEIVATSSDDPFKILLEREERRIFKRCLSRLDQTKRHVVEMRCLGDTYEEIANELGIHTTTAWNWFSEAEQQLTECVQSPEGN